MIKTRGYRVEPEEIERLLVRHPRVTEAVVVPVPDATAGVLLKAVVAATEPQPTTRELKRLCAVHLPDYMIPRFIEFVAELPKTSTGKLDRKRVKAAQSSGLRTNPRTKHYPTAPPSPPPCRASSRKTCCTTAKT